MYTRNKEKQKKWFLLNKEPRSVQVELRRRWKRKKENWLSWWECAKRDCDDMKKETPFVKQKRKPITTPNNNTITITTSCLSVDVISLSINRYTYTHILDLNAHQKSSAVDVAFFYLSWSQPSSYECIHRYILTHTGSSTIKCELIHTHLSC